MCRVNHFNERWTKINTADEGGSRAPEKMKSTAFEFRLNRCNAF